MDETSAAQSPPAASYARRQLQLFLAFFRVGMLGYGGGPGSIPLVHKEVVDSYRWMDDNEFTDILALGNTLPGPIATKMAGYIGYRIGGVVGMLNGVLATIIPTIVIMVVLLTSLAGFSDEPWVQGMTQAVVPVVGVMLGVLTWQFFSRSGEGLGWLKAGLLLAVSLALTEFIGLHPGFIIGALLIFAVVRPVPEDEDTSKAGEDMEEEHLAEGGRHPAEHPEATAMDVEAGPAEGHGERDGDDETPRDSQAKGDDARPDLGGAREEKEPE